MKSFKKVTCKPAVRQRVASMLCAVALLVAASSYQFTSVFARGHHAEQAQPATATKRPLTHQDYDSWRSIQAPQISRDGRFVAYAFMPQDGDGEVVVRNIQTGAEWRAPRGYYPPVPPPDDPGVNIAEFQATQSRLVRPVFTADSRFVVFSVLPTKAEVTKAKKDKKKPEEMPKNALGIIDLTSAPGRSFTRIEKVKSFQVPEDGSGFIAYLLEPKPEEKKAPNSSGSPIAKEGATASSSAPAPEPAASPSSEAGA